MSQKKAERKLSPNPPPAGRPLLIVGELSGGATAEELQAASNRHYSKAALWPPVVCLCLRRHPRDSVSQSSEPFSSFGGPFPAHSLRAGQSWTEKCVWRAWQASGKLADAALEISSIMFRAR